jgi:hypothetical protein
VEDDREPVHLAPEQRPDRLGRDVARREAGAAGGENDVDARILGPGGHPFADRLDLVGDDGAAGELVPRRGQPLDQQASRSVGCLSARVRHRQNGNAQRVEGELSVYSRHGSLQRARS